MGSGHFLIAAVDRIERGMRRFLADRPLAGVNDELRRLERKAREALGAPRATASGDGPELEPSTLLRRQIARRCIHGVDVNETAVELARVAVWIHTRARPAHVDARRQLVKSARRGNTALARCRTPRSRSHPPTRRPERRQSARRAEPSGTSMAEFSLLISPPIRPDRTPQTGRGG